MDSSRPGRRVRLGAFDVNLDSGELVGPGTRARLQGQSLELLEALLDRPGSVVTREELRQRLWPDDTFVDFDHGLNAAVCRLREALTDSADTPRFVETIPRKGYRLIATTEAPPANPAPAIPDTLAPIPDVAPAPRRSARPRLVVGTIAAALAIASGLMAWSAIGAKPTALPPLAILDLHLPSGCFMNRLHAPAVSPDSRYLAFTACGALWIRSLAGTEARRLPIGAVAYSAPFWSADSRSVGFLADRKLWTISVEGEGLQVLAEAPPFEAGGSWTTGGDVLFTPMVGAVLRLTTGGRADPVTSLDATAAGTTATCGHMRFRALTCSPSSRDPEPRSTSGAASAGSALRSVIDLGRTDSRVVPTSSGHLLWVRDGVLLAQALDAARTRPIGRPTAIAHDVAVRVPTLGQFSASADLIVYLSRDDAMAWANMTVFDRQGRVVATVGPPAEYSGPRVSPDGTRVAVGQRDPRTGTRDLWIHDLTGKPPLRLTLDPQDDTSPVWSRDGRTLLFTSDRDGERNLYTRDSGAQKPETRCSHRTRASLSMPGRLTAELSFTTLAVEGPWTPRDARCSRICRW